MGRFYVDDLNIIRPLFEGGDNQISKPFNSDDATTNSLKNKPLIERLNSIEHLIGGTPLFKLKDDTVNLYTKLESFNLMNNVKMRPAYYILRKAIENEEIDKNTTIIESSSGNLGLSLALICSSLGIQFIPVIDPNINPVYEKLLNILSPRVEKVLERDDTGGFLKNRLAKVDSLRKEISNSFWTNQYGNPDNLNAHYFGLGEEIKKSGINFDYIFVAVSTMGTISGISKKIKEFSPNCKVVAVDVNGSTIFDSETQKRNIPGIGSSIKPELLKYSNIDLIRHVQEIDGIMACWNLLRNENLFVGGSSGCVYQATSEYIALNKEDLQGKNILMVFPDGGFPYIDTIFDEEWISTKYEEVAQDALFKSIRHRELQYNLEKMY
ncbi:2,3-diaminopropionate biosynthesis protein SbnA [Bacillus cereus]|uniref:2,3-diaminopropionate biosynthesis protein SbnA n=1 Tax=Bacillus cereus TaxID=1396 RepID=UPI000BF7A1EE|nr:2,3-diaminopropionate biosynthesis protein SbnA [Bacillus cereus]PFD48720.1 2,3-diaminopropionate biosynthesis protein SbnA [Bacillus cereus]PFH95721.1 2,3-diaminopropionate biosynthesis protein SbnA [Bacillus cereus]